jgi:hypothetical protein
MLPLDETITTHESLVNFVVIWVSLIVCPDLNAEHAEDPITYACAYAGTKVRSGVERASHAILGQDIQT